MYRWCGLANVVYTFTAVFKPDVHQMSEAHTFHIRPSSKPISMLERIIARKLSVGRRIKSIVCSSHCNSISNHDLLGKPRAPKAPLSQPAILELSIGHSNQSTLFEEAKTYCQDQASSLRVLKGGMPLQARHHGYGTFGIEVLAQGQIGTRRSAVMRRGTSYKSLNSEVCYRS